MSGVSMAPKPFYRAEAIAQVIQEICLRLPAGLERNMALMNVEAYVSRGKGRHRSKPGRNYLAGAARSKYMPHQGRQECERRVAQRYARGHA